MFHVWFRLIARVNAPADRVRRFRPRLEPLEDRRLLSAAADLTGNGNTDLVITGGGFLSTVFLGNGDGTFQPPTSYLTGDAPLAVQIADVNGDGIPDIITANGGLGTVSVLLGNGDGTFQHKRDFPTGAQLGGFDLAVADLTGSGIVDIATANANDGTVSVLLGNGDGTFKAPTIYPIGSGPSRIVAGRFGSDSDLPDLAVVNVPHDGTSVGTVNVLVNHGDGTFRSAVAYRVGPFPAGIALGDFANTGTLDIAVSDFRTNSVSLLVGNGDHTFRPARNIPFPSAGGDSLVAADFNNDGNPDLAEVTSQGGRHQMSVLLGNGDGTFAPPLNSDLGGPSGITVADFNNDGILDLAMVTSSPDGTLQVSVQFGNGDGTFAPPLDVHTGPDRLPIAAAELNHDGLPDPVTADIVDRSATIRPNDGSGDTAPRRAEASVDTAKRGALEQALALVPFPLEDLGSVVGWPDDPYADPFQARR